MNVAEAVDFLREQFHKFAKRRGMRVVSENGDTICRYCGRGFDPTPWMRTRAGAFVEDEVKSLEAFVARHRHCRARPAR